MTRTELIDDLLIDWEELREQGKAVSADELCRDCPELVDEVRSRIQALEAMYRLTNHGAPVGDTEEWHGNAGAGKSGLPEVAGYEMQGVLGSGGMGTVYKARHVGLNRLVALKMIASGGHAGPKELSRMRAEAEAVARLQHPNIVQIYEVGEHAGLPFLTLEFVDGGSLADHLASGRWNRGSPETIAQAVLLVEAVARAVHAAHQQGIVHRDLKPANILLAFSREPGVAHAASAKSALAEGSRLNEIIPKIADFGIAKRLDADGGLTQTGAIMGTPAYMAPEQAEGDVHAIGPHTDVYALGTILYELLTGQPPFQGSTLLETLEQVRSHEPPRPSALEPKIPRDLDTICLKCLAKDPKDRYGSALELAEDLRRFHEGELIHARAFTLMDLVARSLSREQHVVHFLAFGRLLLWLSPIPLVAHLVVFLLIRHGWHHAVALCGPLVSISTIFPAALIVSASGRQRSTGAWFRDFWSNRISALAGIALLPLLGFLMSSPDRPWEPLTTFPLWALLSGVTLFAMGSSFWGKLYVVGLLLVVVAFVMTIDLEWAVLEFGFAISAAFAFIALRLRRISVERARSDGGVKTRTSEGS